MHGWLLGNDADKVRELQLLNNPAEGRDPTSRVLSFFNADKDVFGI